MAVVRRFQSSDMAQVLDLLEALREETVWAHVPFKSDRTYAANWIRSELPSPTFALYVADDAGSLVGLCGAILMMHPLIPQFQYVTEWAWYVRPEYRATWLGARLLLAACRWGRSLGARGLYGSNKCQSWSDEGRYHFWGVAHG